MNCDEVEEQVALGGRFVCLEGIDGAGKTTTLRTLAELTDRCDGLLTVDKKAPVFTDPVVTTHMRGLRQLLWPDRSEDPFYRLGPMHWMYVMAAWFSTLDHALITPVLASGHTVVIDSWTYKFMARLRTKNVSAGVVDDVFRYVRRPDTVIYLDVEPDAAVRRKARLTLGESGNPADGTPTAARFIGHQQEIRALLEQFAAAGNWVRLVVGSDSVQVVARRALTVIRQAAVPALVPASRSVETWNE